MNRHSPLFRVAFLSLVLAIALPFLVFTAAQVRQRQLHSKANSRWTKFREINGPKEADDQKLAVRPDREPDVKVLQKKPADPKKLAARPVSDSKGLTGSVTGRQEVENRRAIPVEVPVARPQSSQDLRRPAQSEPSKLTPTQVAEVLPPQSSPRVPVPNDLPDTQSIAPPSPRSVSRPRIEFRALDDAPGNVDTTARRLEAQLAGMQRRLDQLAQAQTEKQSSDLDRALNMLQQLQQQAQQAPQNPLPFDPPTPGFDESARQAPRSIPVPPEPQATPQPAPRPGSNSASISGGQSTREPSIKIIQGDVGDNDERFSIHVQEANLAEVLEMLGQLAGVNILSSRDVQGRVSLNLQDVTVDRALDAILKAQGFTYERDGDFVYVRSLAEDSALKMANRKLITKVYQLHYVNANEVQKLIDPVLTKGVGRHAVTSPALSGIAPMPTSAGGDQLSQRDTILVQDYPEVIAEIDRVIIEIDVPPLQVMIEAKILSVALTDSMAFGVNFAMLNGAQNSQLLTGNGQTLNGAVGFPKSPALVPAAGDFVANTAGLKYGFISGDVSLFIKALENIADTTLVAAPQLRVLNKQKAEMIIGERLSYKTLAFNGNQTVENVQFLDAGTKLIFRPFISPDGLVRLEVHPERSKATINESTGLPNSETTEVTTNVMVRDGTTVVLGGLISEEVTESIDRVPYLGALPVVGAAFRNRTERTQRNELIVLITPHIVTEPEAAIEGEKLQFETQERAAYFRDNLSVVNRTSLTRAHYDRAVFYFEQGNLLKAKQQVDAALLQNKGDLECQRLRLKIDQAIRDQQSKAWRWPMSRTASR